MFICLLVLLGSFNKEVKYRNVYNWFDVAFRILVEKLKSKNSSTAESLFNWFIAEKH